MKKMLFGSLVTLLSTAVAGGAGSRAAPAVGDKAPEFQLPGSDGKLHKLSDFRGKQAVVIAWYPKAFTGG